MRWTEPPRIATWMLEHCVFGDCHEAVAGDIREGYSSGLSNGWYWRQVFSACAVSWSQSLRVRTPLLIFTLLWSVLAPTWKVFIGGIQSAAVFDKIYLALGPFWVFPAFAEWLLLNGIFLWAGIVVYLLPLSIFRKGFPRNEIRRALLLAPFVYALVFGAWFALCCLDWSNQSYVFAEQALATMPRWGQIADLRLLADVTRFPYFITLVCVLWNAIPQSRLNSRILPVDSPPFELLTQDDALIRIPSLDLSTVKRFVGFMAVSGLINAMIAGILFCRLLEIDLPNFSTLLARSVLHVVTGVVAGVAGSWLYWKSPLSPYRERSPISFPLFALVCASAWVWVPSMIIFSEQLSPASAIVAATGAMSLAVGLRYATFHVLAPAASDAPSYELEDTELFSRSLYQAPWEAQGYVIAFLLYAGGCALAMRQNLAAAALFAMCAFLFVWNQTRGPAHNIDSSYGYRRASLRLACVTIPAVLVTIWALLDGATQRARAANMNAPTSKSSSNQATHQKTKSQSSAYGLGGYESLILWPAPEKKQIVPPLPDISLLAPGTTQPLTIPFSGQYWYLQPPNKIPGPAAHHTHGTPLGGEIASINSTPLVMEAHQILGAAIPVARCREIQVEIENRDNRIGAIALAVSLTNAASPKTPTLYLGQQSILSTEPAHFSYKSKSVFETLRFSVPADTKLRRFDEITLRMVPDAGHALIGPKIAINRLRLVPR